MAGRRTKPAAIIIHGTLSSQRTITGTLQELAERLEEQPISEAALLIVGKVVNFREHLRWFDSRALFGRRALVMDSKRRAGRYRRPAPRARRRRDQRHRRGRRCLSPAARSEDRPRHVHQRIGSVEFCRQRTAPTRRRICSVTPWSPRWAPSAADAANRAHISPAVQLQEGSLARSQRRSPALQQLRHPVALRTRTQLQLYARASDSQSTQSG